MALGSFIGTKETKAELPAEPENTLTIMAELSWPAALRCALHHVSAVLVGAFYMDRAGTVYMKDEVAIPEGEIRSTDWYRRAEESPNSVVLGCYDTSRTRVVRTSQQNKQMVLVTAMATDTATDRTGAVETVSFFTVSQVGDILAGQRKDAVLGRSVILDRDGHVIFGDMGDDAVRDYFEDRPGRFTPGSLTRRASLAEDGGERDYFFRTRTIPDTDWSVVTFVEESSLGQRFYQVGGILALIVIGLMTLFYFYSRYFLNAIIAPVQEVCRGMERLDQNDLEVQLEPKGQRKLWSALYPALFAVMSAWDELEMLKTYVYLMRIRYSNGFEVSYDVQPDCLDYLLPRLTLQPVVENAITHGFNEMAEELGKIKISVYREEGFLCLSVWDNGRGMSREEIDLVQKGRPREKNDNTSIGLENVRARIRLNFGAAAGLTLDSELEQYTRATLRLPLAACAKKEEERRDSDPDCG